MTSSSLPWGGSRRRHLKNTSPRASRTRTAARRKSKELHRCGLTVARATIPKQRSRTQSQELRMEPGETSVYLRPRGTVNILLAELNEM